MIFPITQSLDVQELIWRMSASPAAANDLRNWDAAGDLLKTYAATAPPLRTAPEHFREGWARLQSGDAKEPHLLINEHRNELSRFGEPCATLEMELKSTDEVYGPMCNFLLRGRSGEKGVEVLGTSEGIYVPFNENPPVLIGNRLTIAGMGSTGAMRLSPILQLFKKRGGRWSLEQTVLREHFAGNGYWGVKARKRDPNHFVMEVPTDSELTQGQHPAEPRTITIEHWLYDGNRYRLRYAHIWDTAFHAAETYLIAIRHGRNSTARRFASPALVARSRRLTLGTLAFNGKLMWMSPTAIDLETSNFSETPPTRLVFRHTSAGWKLRKIIPNCMARNTWWSWGIRYDRARKHHQPAPPDPRTISRCLH